MKNQIIVYGKESGVATTATFLGNEWWITSKDEPLEPLYSGEPYDQSDYRYLCEKDEMVLLRDLAGLMGSAMECSGDNIKEVLKSRLKDLNALGVKFLAMPQVLNLEVRVKDGINGYSATCDDGDIYRKRFFEIEGFDSAKQVWDKVRAYMDFFMKHGVKVQTRLLCRREIMDELAGLTQGVKVEMTDNNL